MFHLLQQFLVRRPIRRIASPAAAATALAVLAPFFASGQDDGRSGPTTLRARATTNVHAHVRQSVVQEAAPTRRPQPPP
jgi:hypothetical protein